MAVELVSEVVADSFSQLSAEDDESSSSGENGRGKNRGPTWYDPSSCEVMLYMGATRRVAESCCRRNDCCETACSCHPSGILNESRATPKVAPAKR